MNYQDLSEFIHAKAGDPINAAKVLTAWQWASLLPGGHGTPPTVPQDVPTVLNASCGWREWFTAVLFDEIGIRERQVNFYDVPFQGGHTALELYINNEWMFFDPTFGIYFESTKGGTPLSIEEARAGWPNVVVKQCSLEGWQGAFVNPYSINATTVFKTVTDPFLYMPESFSGSPKVVGGELWSLYFGPNAAYYDGANDTFLPSSRNWQETVDTNNSQTYQRLVDNFDAAGRLDFRYGFSDDGGTFFIDYDQGNKFNWTTKTTAVDNHSLLGLTLIAYDNGRHGVIGTPDDDTIVGDATSETFQGGLGDDWIDGGSGTDTFHFAGNRSSYKVVGDVIQATVAGPDGRDTLLNGEYLKFADQILPLPANIVTVQDTADMYTWNERSAYFDAAGRRLSVVYEYENDSQYIYQYDALSQFRWATVETRYDAQGGRPLVLYDNDNGTTTVYQFDLTDQFAWSSVETNFNAAGKRNIVIYNNDDHSRVAYQFDVAGQFTWLKMARYFDASGAKTKDVYDNDAGDHTVYTYDVAGNTKSADHFDASWHLIV